MNIKLLKLIRENFVVVHHDNKLSAYIRVGSSENPSYHECVTVNQLVAYMLRDIWGKKKFQRKYKTQEKRIRERRNKRESEKALIDIIANKYDKRLIDKL